MSHSNIRKSLILLLVGLLIVSCTAQGAGQPNRAFQVDVQNSQPTATLLPSHTPVPPTATLLPATDTPVPPSATPLPTETQVPPTPTLDMQAVMGSAKILLFEDMVSWGYIKKGLDKAGIKVTFVGDRIGTFKNEITSGNRWDLIIAAAEGRGGVQGEFFDYLKDQLDQGASVILEMWTLDMNSKGRLAPILEQCGVEFQANWVNPSDRGVYWVDPTSPLASQPNKVSLVRFTNFWVGDIGDLVKKTAGSQAQIVASANKANPDKDGLITVCYDGRLILQTFSTHDHAEKDAMKLWQNYVYFALKTRAEQGSK